MFQTGMHANPSAKMMNELWALSSGRCTRNRPCKRESRRMISIHIYAPRVETAFLRRFSHLPLRTCTIWLDYQNMERETTRQAMVSLSLKLALIAPLLLLLAAQTLQPVAGQALPTPTPCKGAINATTKIKDGFIFREGLSPPLDPGLARTLPYEGKKSDTWTNSSQYFAIPE